MQKLLKFILPNLDVLVPLVVGFAATCFGIFGGSQSWILGGIALSLVVLCFIIIKDREARASLAELLISLNQSMNRFSSQRVNADTFFITRNELKPFSDRIRKARSVDLFGGSLRVIIISEQRNMIDLKNSGAHIRLLVSNPDNYELQKFLCSRFPEATDPDIHISLIKSGLRSIAPFIGKSESGGSLEIRATDTVQSFSYVGVDTSDLNGQISVEFYLHQVAVGKCPLFLLTAKDDPHWHNMWRNQFELLWETAKEIDVNKIRHANK